MKAAAISISIFLAGTVTAGIAGMVMRSFIESVTGFRRGVLLGGPLLWLVSAPLWIAVGLSFSVPFGAFFGIGVALLGWAVLTLGLMWNILVDRSVERYRDGVLSEHKDIEARFRSNPLMRWLLPKRRDE